MVEITGQKFSFPQRPRRNRRTQAIRDLVCETVLRPQDLIQPLFVMEGKNVREAISSMPGQYRLSLDLVIETCREMADLGVPAVALFPVIPNEKKDARATESANPNGLLQRTIAEIKAKVSAMTVISDVAMDPYSTDGHDGVVRDGEILNDETLPILVEMALAQARAGVDFVAPSDMMDGRVGVIRKALDDAGFSNVGILSYAVKYASSFYGPFREALDSAPRMGDKKTYQMDPANVEEALREVALDIEEGADIVMVKPALAYLDVIRRVKETFRMPVAAYNVSGEVSMIKAAALNGWLDERAAAMEALTGMRRAGAHILITYYAKEVARWLNE